jgi:S-(hydroxymethyl)glutathione dehydrogenase/alcohol dehydrogenase
MMALQEKCIKGTMYGSVRPEHRLPQVRGSLSRGRLKIDELVSRTYKLDQINEASPPCARPGGPRRDRIRLSPR